jgi:hypothetical protein
VCHICTCLDFPSTGREVRTGIIAVQRPTENPYDSPNKFWGANGDISIIWRIRKLSVPLNRLVCTCRSVRCAAQDEQRINELYVLIPLSHEAHFRQEITVSSMVEAPAALSKAVVPISRHDVSICILAERSSCWRRHRGLLKGHGRSPSLSRRSHGPIPSWNHFKFFLSLKIHVARCLLMHHSGIWGSFVAPCISSASQSTQGRREHVPSFRRKSRSFSG